MQYLLTIDAGTTSIKVGIFQTNGDLKAISTKEYTLLTPSSTNVELPVHVYWSACKNGIADALKSSKVNPKTIVALSISSQGETLIPIDKKGRALKNAIVWLDTRAKNEAFEISKVFPIDKFYSITGLPDINPTWPVAKILWIKKNEPDIFNHTFKFLLLKDYLIFKLTREFVTEPTVSSSTGFLKLKKNKWWDDMLDFIGIKENQLPKIFSPTSTKITVFKEV